MAVKKHPDGKRWIADYYYRDAAGALKRREKILTTKQAGVDWIAAEKAALKGPKKKKRDTRTIAEMIEWFKTRPAYKQVEPNTRESYAYRIKLFLDWCTDNGLLTLKQFFDPDSEEDGHSNAEAYFEYLGTRYEPSTVATHIQVIRHVANTEIRRKDKYWTSNPFETIKTDRLGGHEVRWFTPEELTALKASMNEFDSHLFDLLLHTGIRTGELRYLTWEQVLPDHIKITPHDGWKPKHGKRRNIPLNQRAKECIAYFRTLFGDKKHVIVARGKSGEQPIGKTYVHKRYTALVNRAKKASKLPFTDAVVHTFRATCGSLMLQRGVPIAFVSSFLGHADIRTTMQHYASLAQENLEFAAKALDDLN